MHHKPTRFHSIVVRRKNTQVTCSGSVAAPRMKQEPPPQTKLLGSLGSLQALASGVFMDGTFEFQKNGELAGAGFLKDPITSVDLSSPKRENHWPAFGKQQFVAYLELWPVFVVCIITENSLQVVWRCCMSPFHLMVWFSCRQAIWTVLAGGMLNERRVIRAKPVIEALLLSHSFLTTISDFSSSHMAPKLEEVVGDKQSSPNNCFIGMRSLPSIGNDMTVLKRGWATQRETSLSALQHPNSDGSFQVLTHSPIVVSAHFCPDFIRLPHIIVLVYPIWPIGVHIKTGCVCWSCPCHVTLPATGGQRLNIFFLKASSPNVNCSFCEGWAGWSKIHVFTPVP